MIAFELRGRPPAALAGTALTRIGEEVARALSRGDARKDWLVTVGFIGSAEIRRLNASYRGIDRETDVLSFSAGTDRAYPLIAGGKTPRYERGDVLICASYAKRGASERGIPWAEELARLIVHGTLHLFGFDHERLRDERVMFPIQERIVARLQGKRPVSDSLRTKK